MLPLREPHALLAFLLRLQGSQPSLRHRAFTFQAAGLPADCAAADASISALAAVPLASSVFEEAPNPSALTDGAAAVSVLLPGELGLPTGAYAGSEAVQVRFGATLWVVVWTWFDDAPCELADCTAGSPAPLNPTPPSRL